MKKEIHNYPYNGRIEDEIKIFLSDQICKQLVSITYRNRQVFCTIRDKVTHKKRKIAVSAAFILTLLFGIPKQVEAIGVGPIVTSAPEIHRPAQQPFRQYASTVNLRLDKIRLVAKEPRIVLIRTKSDLRNPQWIKELISGIRGGDDTLDEELIRSIISKVSESDWDIPGINKIFKKLAEVTLEIGSNDKLMRILTELQKPIAESPLTVISSNEVEWKKENKCSTPSADYLLDSTKCYGHREAYNMPRSVSERFETNAVKNLAKTSLKNPRLKKGI